MRPLMTVIGLTLVTLALSLLDVSPALAKDYLLAVSRPNRLYLIDAGARKIERTYDIPGGGIPSTIAVAAEKPSVAYVTTGRWDAVSGIDLDSGKEVFRANLNEGDTRVKSMFAMNVSRDGKELYMHQSPVRLKTDEYEVQDTRIAVYDTAAGLDAKPKRVFPAPRRIALLMPGAEPGRLYALGWDLYAFNTATGQIDKTFGVRNWQRANYAEPDVFDVWLQYEQANMFSSPFYAVRTDKPQGDPSSFKTGMMTFDLKTETLKFQDFEDTSAVIFSSVINPVRRNEAYGIYTQLSKIDLDQEKLVKRVDLDHTYYSVNVSSDGKELYVGGTMDNIAVHDSNTLERIGNITLPGGGDQSTAGVRVVQR